jgi:hypothetical protein
MVISKDTIWPLSMHVRKDSFTYRCLLDTYMNQMEVMGVERDRVTGEWTWRLSDALAYKLAGVHVLLEDYLVTDLFRAFGMYRWRWGTVRHDIWPYLPAEVEARNLPLYISIFLSFLAWKSKRLQYCGARGEQEVRELVAGNLRQEPALQVAATLRQVYGVVRYGLAYTEGFRTRGRFGSNYSVFKGRREGGKFGYEWEGEFYSRVKDVITTPARKESFGIVLGLDVHFSPCVKIIWMGSSLLILRLCVFPTNSRGRGVEKYYPLFNFLNFFTSYINIFLFIMRRRVTGWMAFVSSVGKVWMFICSFASAILGSCIFFLRDFWTGYFMICVVVLVSCFVFYWRNRDFLYSIILRPYQNLMTCQIGDFYCSSEIVGGWTILRVRFSTCNYFAWAERWRSTVYIGVGTLERDKYVRKLKRLNEGFVVRWGNNGGVQPDFVVVAIEFKLGGKNNTKGLLKIEQHCTLARTRVLSRGWRARKRDGQLLDKGLFLKRLQEVVMSITCSIRVRCDVQADYDWLYCVGLISTTERRLRLINRILTSFCVVFLVGTDRSSVYSVRKGTMFRWEDVGRYAYVPVMLVKEYFEIDNKGCGLNISAKGVEIMIYEFFMVYQKVVLQYYYLDGGWWYVDKDFNLLWKTEEEYVNFMVGRFVSNDIKICLQPNRVALQGKILFDAILRRQDVIGELLRRKGGWQYQPYWEGAKWSYRPDKNFVGYGDYERIV